VENTQFLYLPLFLGPSGLGHGETDVLNCADGGAGIIGGVFPQRQWY